MVFKPEISNMAPVVNMYTVKQTGIGAPLPGSSYKDKLPFNESKVIGLQQACF